MRSTKYTAEVLAPIVASSRSLADVIRAFGLRPTGGNYRFLKGQIRRAGLDTSHFGCGTIRRSVAAIPAETLAILVSQSSSVAQVLGALGLQAKGRAHHELTKRIIRLGLDTSHHL